MHIEIQTQYELYFWRMIINHIAFYSSSRISLHPVRPKPTHIWMWRACRRQPSVHQPWNPGEKMARARGRRHEGTRAIAKSSIGLWEKRRRTHGRSVKLTAWGSIYWIALYVRVLYVLRSQVYVNLLYTVREKYRDIVMIANYDLCVRFDFSTMSIVIVKFYCPS